MDSIIQNDARSPWHEGELILQRQAGVAERTAVAGRRAIRDHLIEQHRGFYAQLPFIVAGTVDPAGDAWATILCGKPGFLQSPDPATLHVAGRRDWADPADAGLDDGDAVGLLGIEFHTRRRNRLNGTVRREGAGGFDVVVSESYGNCPQYIRLRDFAFIRDPTEAAAQAAQTASALDARMSAMIAQAETFFIASYVDRDGANHQVDVSHRGGRPGFVRVGEDGVLTIPDFAGNQYFNTLGNVIANPGCGLAFVDFATGDLLQLTGDGEVVLDSPEIAAFQGAERLLRFTPRHIVFRPGALPLRWTSRPDGASPNALMAGNWTEVTARLEAAALASTWRPFRVAGIAEETAAIRSLLLEPADGGGLVAHQAGQHLPVRLTPADTLVPAVRNYTLSSAPSDGVYRISVKREGSVSRQLHALEVGDIVEARGPAGAFTIDAASTRPAVLLAAGIGVTPMLAMLRHLVHEGLRTRRIRPVWFFQAARTKAERAFDREVAALASAAEGAVRVVRVLSDPMGASEDDYEVYGRLDMRLLRAAVPLEACDFYLCGPGAFMQGLYDGLREASVPESRIHTEAFGPSSLRRVSGRDRTRGMGNEPARAAVDVAFAASGKHARWTPGSGSLLDLAEAQGLSPPFECRSGTCGTCRTRILEGAVSYEIPPSAEIGDDEALICCAVPAISKQGGERLNLQL